jgi:hypothetical protein
VNNFCESGLSRLGFIDLMICSFKGKAEQPADLLFVIDDQRAAG